jgi:hypothetical protein
MLHLRISYKQTLNTIENIEHTLGGAKMVEKTSKNLLLLAILAIAFAYRFSLMTMNTFPPGADIGLYESVIKSITSGKTNFFWNYYQMGGGLSVTNPGYSIFAAFVISMTGLPDYLAQALVASFFSAFIVLCAFLIVRRVWSELAGFIVAVLVTFSASDIVMLNWAGYPTIITLMLIPIVFYLFLHPSKLSSKSYLAVTSILISAIFLTEIFSAFVFIAITIFALFIGALFSKKTGLSKKQAISWLMPIAFGALLVSPYLVNIVPVYFSSEGTITGTVSEVSQAVLETSLIPLEIICLCLIPVFLFFVFSKYQNGKFLSMPTILFASWILVPALATQSYLFGVYLTYELFLYFLALPVIICVGLVIANSPNALSRVAPILGNSIKLKIKAKPAFNLSTKALTVALLSILIVFTLFTPLFALPNVGVSQADYFQVMTPSEYQAIQWVKAYTPVGSVCVADAEFGWWLSGFAQRPTLSAVDPQYLILQHEVGPANVATNLLTADYLIDNGLIQIEQAGAYANGNTHEILAILNNTSIHPTVFSINDTQISVLYTENGAPQQLSLAEFTNTNTYVESNLDNASFIITRENPLLNVTEEITLFKGVSFAEISFILQNNTGNVNFDWLQLPFQSRGFPLQYANSIAIVDNVMHELSQIVFPEGKLGSDVVMQENPSSYELIYNLQGNSTSKISFFVGLCQFNPDTETNQANYYNNLIENNTENYLDTISNLPLNCFDYQTEISEWNISYIAVTDFDSLPRFYDDPMFALVFKNDQVAIFKVIKS